MTSRPLFMRVALSTLILRPIDHFGCLTAISGVMPERSRRPRKGPPEAVKTIRADARASSEAPTKHWKIALCSLSRGNRVAPERFTSSMRSAPPQTTLSLFARSKRFPARAARKVGSTPAAPTTACTTESTSGSPASSATAAAPARTSASTPAARRAAASSSFFDSVAIATMRGRNSRAASTRGSTRVAPAIE